MRYHLYCDESGQQSEGEYFVVGAAVVVEQERARIKVSELEHLAGRVDRKWSRSTLQQKKRFLAMVEPLLAEIGPVYFRVYRGGTEYWTWTLDVLAAVALTRDPAGEWFIMIDGLTDAPGTRAGLRQHGVIVKKVRGGREESDPLLRLADFVAGVVGENVRGKPYLAPYWALLQPHFQTV